MSSERDTELIASIALREALRRSDWVANQLVDKIGSAAAVLGASREVLLGAGLGPAWVDPVHRADLSEARQEIERARGGKVRVLARSDPEFPERLRRIEDCPLALWVHGELEASEVAPVAIVGARKSSPYGIATAERLGRELAALGATVVSGLARGIDGAAHRGALAGGGRTLAVLASGVDRIYPPGHRRLADEIVRSGALVSDFPVGTPPLSWHFPLRNRLISGLSEAVVVVEANARSGSLITARCALEQNREVFAVPGQVGTDGTRGTHRLLRDGARLVESGAHVIEEIAPHLLAKRRETGETRSLPPILPADERKVLESFDEPVVSVDRLIERSGLDAARTHAGLVALELRGLVKPVGGMFYSRDPE